MTSRNHPTDLTFLTKERQGKQKLQSLCLVTVRRPTFSSVTEKHARPSAILFQFSCTNMH
jgi:hypothetical protein